MIVLFLLTYYSFFRKTTLTTTARANIALAREYYTIVGIVDILLAAEQCSYLTSFERSRGVRRSGIVVCVVFLLFIKSVPALGLEGDLFAVAANEVNAVFGFGDMTNEIDILQRNEFLVII